MQSHIKTPIFLAGWPGRIGGAQTEIWHTLVLWRRMGLDVRVLPTWTPEERRADAALAADVPYWTERMRGIGCRVHDHEIRLARIPGLRGAIVVGFCDPRFVAWAPQLWHLHCRLVWVPCMCQPTFRLAGHPGGPPVRPFDRYVFQSQFQLREYRRHAAAIRVSLVRDPHYVPYQTLGDYLEPAARGTPERAVVIRGAFDLDEFPFLPPPENRGVPTGQPPYVGRISRANPAKFRRDLWKIHARIRQFGPVTARVLGWDAAVEAKCGPPPACAEVYAENQVHPDAFLRACDVLLQQTDPEGPPENWPRVGLEAMAAGVPVVADRRGGWPELIQTGYNGLLVDTAEQAPCAVAALLSAPAARRRLARNARDCLEALYGDPRTTGQKWIELFEGLLAS